MTTWKLWTPAEEATAREMVAAGARINDIAGAIGKTREAVKGWKYRQKLVKHHPERRRKIPDDFAAFFPAHTRDECRKHWKTSYETLSAWVAQSGLNLQPKNPLKIEMPADFREIAPKLTLAEANARWGINYRTLQRLYGEAGLHPHYIRKPAVKITQGVGFAMSSDGTLAGMAASWLRSSSGGRVPNVYRATVLDERQRAHLPGKGRDHYFVAGHGMMSIAEMIELARGMGFQREMAA